MKSTIGPVRHHGFTLIELMVAMLLGLVIIGGATGVIIANRQSYRTNEALSQVQESARTAFELLARDAREAGISGCDSNGRMSNVLRPAAGFWWQTWFGMAGYDGTAANPAVVIGTDPGQRVQGTDSVNVQGIRGLGLSVESHEPTSANFKLNAPSAAIAAGDVLVACDFDHAAMFQVTNYNSGNVTLVHNTGNSVTPGNYTKGLGYPPINTENGNPYTFGPNSQIARLSAVAWYIGNNNRPGEGGRSLYRRRLDSGAAVATEEVVAGVSNMEITYREEGVAQFRDATNVTDWWNVNAMMITLTVQSADQRVSTDATVNAGRIERRFTNVIALRNRVP